MWLTDSLVCMLVEVVGLILSGDTHQGVPHRISKSDRIYDRVPTDLTKYFSMTFARHFLILHGHLSSRFCINDIRGKASENADFLHS